MIVLLFLMVVHTIGKAENIIQVVPFETKAGLTTDDVQSFSIEMRNSEKQMRKGLGKSPRKIMFPGP